LAAIVDIEANKIIAIQPNRQGDKVATWNWNGSHLQVASVDGVTDDYQLRTGPVAVVGAVGAPKPYGMPGDVAAPWDQQIGMQPPARVDPRPQRRYKPKTLFDLFFGN
jgi:hypothetical protein